MEVTRIKWKERRELYADLSRRVCYSCLCEPHRAQNIRIAGAAAQVPGQILADFVV